MQCQGPSGLSIFVDIVTACSEGQSLVNLLIAMVPTYREAAVLYCGLDCAIRFVQVGAVAEPALSD